MRFVWCCGGLAAVLLLGGCGGGRFATSDPEDLPVSCVAKPARGNCAGRRVKYYYDYRDNRCKSFNYSGCGGRVPFETLEDCVNYCGAVP
ncbi:BPTI/Kunitz domain-containing protein [uncultured Thiodictyon sp.]|jgi:hypothetical protein|uniref:BPTI/Kunitz domain-containing protein n=1 Tax=uncultured Thiodictyon sp. TaxID=1846217 RepID=UPI0025CF323E|nr:BPTI/Kunitz domain-containing protein [uncultured Thiodictyon sp.]